jgi:hypothetical protein
MSGSLMSLDEYQIPLHADEKRRTLRHLTPNFYNYGASETAILAVLRPDNHLEQAVGVGQPRSLVEIGGIDGENRALARGHFGRLRCRGPTLGSPAPGSASEAAEPNFYDGCCYPGEAAWVDGALQEHPRRRQSRRDRRGN